MDTPPYRPLDKTFPDLLTHNINGGPLFHPLTVLKGKIEYSAHCSIEINQRPLEDKILQEATFRTLRWEVQHRQTTWHEEPTQTDTLSPTLQDCRVAFLMM